MHVLRVEHAVVDFDAWKQVFDSDLGRRAESGVRRYRILRGIDEPDLVMVDLEFDSAPEAQAMLVRLQSLWRRVDGVLVIAPHGRVLEVTETVEI